ncbi:putative RNA-binding domain superfamily [Helianthus annuus]|nr:putative RNA-binding domain superfamily [Helianthus annuus]
MGDSSLGVMKFFVTNLPYRSSSKDIGEVFSEYGEVVGVYVARKRWVPTSSWLKGIKMGSYNLLVNVAKYAVENSGFPAQQLVRNVQSNSSGRLEAKIDNFRDQRSYSDVLGKSKASGISAKDQGGLGGSGVVSYVKSVIVPDRTSAFKDLVGSAVIGRMVDLETLVDFDKLLSIAKVEVAKFQYLGGLSTIISFQDSVAANKFLEARNIWGPWFSKLEPWGGQSLPMERVAWLSLHSIPLHLLESDVLSQVGELFGIVLHVPEVLRENCDLSVFKIGVLVGEVQRIREVVSLKWKDRSFRVWVQEDKDVWVPDSLEGEFFGTLASGSPLKSPPMVEVADPESGEDGEFQKMEGVENAEESHVNVADSPEVDCAMHEEVNRHEEYQNNYTFF